MVEGAHKKSQISGGCRENWWQVVRLWRRLVFSCLGLICLSGCAMQQISNSGTGGSFVVLPKKYRTRAVNYERQGMFSEAIQSWEVVSQFYPDDIKIKEKIETLRKRSRVVAAKHYRQGVGYFQQGLMSRARREFLFTLACDKDHKEALSFLLTKLQQPVFTSYTVSSGDTLKEIARRKLRDPDRAVLLETFNDIDPARPLVPGSRLKLLVVEKDFPGIVQTVQKPPVSPEKDVYQAPKVVREKSNSAVAQITYGKAKHYLNRKEYRKSLQLLREMDISYRDVRGLIASTEASLAREAADHYRKGISYFLSEDLEKAIAEWEEVLRLDPDHKKARKDLKNARKMQKQVEQY